MGNKIIIGTIVGGALVAGGVFLMERILHVHTPSPEELGEIVRERVSEDLEAYLGAMDALSEMDGDDD